MNTHKQKSPRAFTLVMTVSMMVLLAMVAIGLLSLSTVELRRSGSADARSIALANARC